MRETDIGTFLRWGAAVTVDAAEKMIRFLPYSRYEDLVDIPAEDNPEDEALDIRCSSL